MSKKSVTEKELGQLLYKSKLNWIIQGLKIVLVALGFFIVFAMVVSFTYPENSVNDSIGNQLGGLILGAIFAFITLAFLINIVLVLPKSVIVYEHGVKFRYFRHSVTRLWEEFEQIKLTKVNYPYTVTSKIVFFSIYDYVIKDCDGNTLRINYDYFFVKFLGNLIVPPIHKHLFEQYLSKFQQGEMLHFGNVSLSTWYVAKGGNRKRWIEIERWEVDLISTSNPNVTFYFKERPILYMSLNGVPNASVFISLLDEIEKR